MANNTEQLREKIIEATKAVLLGGEMPEPGSKADYLKSSQHSPLTDPLAFRKYLAERIANAVTPLVEAEATRARIDVLKKVLSESNPRWTHENVVNELKRQAEGEK